MIKSLVVKGYYYPHTYLLAVLAGLFCAVVLYGVMPLVAGLSPVSALFSLEHFILLLMGITGITGYLYVLHTVFKQPQLLLYFAAFGWPVAEFLKEILFTHYGINTHLTLIIFMIYALPAGLFGLRYVIPILWNFPHFKYFLLFWLWIVICYKFHNVHAIDPRLAMENVWFEGSAGLTQVLSLTFSLCAVILAAVATMKHPDPTHLFDGFNRWLLGFTAVTALIATICYPLGLLVQDVDGFIRLQGLYLHPNLYAHYLALVLLYGFGLVAYYQGSRKSRFPTWLLLLCLGLISIAFLLALSKTAIAALLLCMGLMFVFNFFTPSFRKAMLWLLLGMAVLVPAGFLIFELVSQEGFFSILQSRVDQMASFNWRVKVWGDLLGNMGGGWLLKGHGLTAANELLYLLSYNNEWKAQPLVLVHNGYIGLFYDLGLMGLLLFIGVLSLMWNAFVSWFRRISRLVKPLYATIMALCLYFLIVCGFDEMVFMFNAAPMFWLLGTLLYATALREVKG